MLITSPASRGASVGVRRAGSADVRCTAGSVPAKAENAVPGLTRSQAAESQLRARSARGAGPSERPASGAAKQRTAIALLAIVAISVHLLLRYAFTIHGVVSQSPLLIALLIGGFPLVYDLAVSLLRRQFGSDLLAGISIVTSLVLGEYLAGTLVVLMLSGGQALEAYAVRSASSVLRALAGRMPSIAHRKEEAGVDDIPLNDVAVGDVLIVFPHEICPIDGVVVDGHGVIAGHV